MNRLVQCALGVAVLLASVTGVTAEGAPDLSTPGMVARGRDLFGESCSYCHGEGGIGGASGAPSLRGRADLSAAELFETITRGRINGMNIMPGWEEALSEEQRWALVAFLRSMAVPGK